ncbi:MAG: (2Fe-2S)-binding protein [Bdellovibrionales bacterium]|nr:(2Fe-2S)-binding protein [Bdellovibrionales bacterium]
MSEDQKTHKIRFKKGREPIDVPDGAILMEALVERDIPVASSCGGEGVCTKCILDIVEGRENLSKPNELELDLIDIHDIPKNKRVSCQTEIFGDITIDAPYW